jgi:hypothetical protein
VSGQGAVPAKTMRIRYAGRCRTCGRELPAGTLAAYDRDTKTLTCLNCLPEQQSATADVIHSTTAEPFDGSNGERPGSEPDTPEVFVGVAGASARREYDRRKNKRETRIRDHHSLAGGLILALTDDPQSTKAWATGARGEERLGHWLDRLAGHGVYVLHDRRIPRTRANIDHIAVGPSGVFVVDAKKYRGRPSLRVEGGLIRPRVEKLIVGSRDRTRLAAGVQKQVDLVRSALQKAEFGQIPVSGMLCFVEADWPLIGGDFTIANLRVLWPRKAADRIARPGNVDDETAQHVHRILASAFPPA